LKKKREEMLGKKKKRENRRGGGILSITFPTVRRLRKGRERGSKKMENPGPQRCVCDG